MAQVTDSAQRTDRREFQVTINLPALPPIRITDLPDSAEPSEQRRGNIALTSRYPTSIRALLGFTFTPDGNLPSDPDIGFLDSRVIVPSIPIEVPANTDPAGFDFQVGTIAGVIRINVTSESGTDITPSPVPTIVVNRRAPVITSVTIGARTASSFEVVIEGYSNIRAVGQGIFRFTGRTGSNLQTESIPIDLTNGLQATLTP
jgi:hypothetical protein